MPLERPRPVPDPVSAGLWEAAARGELAVQRCAACRRFQHPPQPLCRACGSTATAFERVSGEARLWSWTTTYHNVLPGFAAALPYVNIVVELVEQAGLFFVSDLVGRNGAAALRLGAPMRAVFPQPADGGPVLPQFEATAGTA
jgi:uncharacterized OB-fold protein